MNKIATFLAALTLSSPLYATTPEQKMKDYLNQQKVEFRWYQHVDTGEVRIGTFGNRELAHPVAICQLVTERFPEVYVSIVGNVQLVNGKDLVTTYECNPPLPEPEKFNNKKDEEIQI